MVDFLLRNALVVDGTGAPGRVADVAVDGGRIAVVGALGEMSAEQVIDLDGLVLAPGFIDVHTHFDAQVLWDPMLTPSSWHGVTSVVTGNTGFGVAPLRAADSELVRDVLCTVEGMPAATVDVVLGRDYPTFADYLDDVRRSAPVLNVGALVGHSALRVFAMGSDALDRPATDDEVDVMVDALAAAMTAGAIGLGTSRSPGHLGPPGRAVPSRMAALSELEALADVLGRAGRGVIQVTPGPDFYIEEMARLSARIGRPITWAALLGSMDNFGSSRVAPGRAMAILNEASALGGEVWPQISCRPVVTSFTMLDPYTLRRLPAFKELLTMERAARPAAYAGAWRARAEEELAHGWDDRFENIFVVESGLPPASWSGRNLRALAAERGSSPAATMIDLALEDDLQIRYQVRLFNDDEDEVAGLLADDRCVLGLSDAGAHSDQLCDAVFPTHLLGTWVRDKGRLSLERAVWHLSGQPARALRLAGRGELRPGFAADLVAFDPSTVGDLPLHRVADLPGGCERLVGESTGIEHVWVNGVDIMTDGKVDGTACSGQLLEAAP